MNTYVAVNRTALDHNARQVRGHLHPQSRLLAVVKANAYGHGLVQAARVFVAAGAQWLGVSTVDEGVQLREAGLDAPILTFLPPLGGDELAALVAHRLTATVVAVSQYHDLAAACREQQQTATCHIYVDGGLGRLGGDDSLPDLLDALRAFPAVAATGIYTHFGPPGSGELLEELAVLRPGGAVRGFAALAREAAAQFAGERPLLHVAASTLFLESRDHHLDLVRVGTLLYGQYPDHVRERPLNLRDDTFALRSRIVALHTLPAGAKIGYGGEYVCRRETRIATVPVGVAHGLETVPASVAARPRSLLKALLAQRANRRGDTRYAPQARLEGRAAPLVGRVSMDQCCLDVTDLPEAQIGSEVTLPIRRLAASAALPRVYVDDVQA